MGSYHGTGGATDAARFASQLRKALFLALAFLSQSCLAADYFGAIAYSPSSGAHGWAKDHQSRRAAEHAAVSACSKHAEDCRSVMWFKNGCGALAVSGKAYGWGWGTTQKLADNQALKACEKLGPDCKVASRACTTNSGTEP